MIKKYYKLLLTVFILSLPLLLSSCESSCVGVYVKRPAEINIKKYNKVAVADIVDQNGFTSPHSLEFYENLLVMLSKNKFIEVFDKARIRTLLKEKNLWNKQEIITENEAGQMTVLFGPTAFITGRIQEDDYREGMTVSDPIQDSQDSTKKYIDKSIEGKYKLTVFIKVISSDNSKLINSKILTATKTAKSEIRLDYPKQKHKMPAEINKSELFRQCMYDILDQFDPVLTPHEVYKTVCFKTEKEELPETESAISLIKKDHWQSGAEILRKCTNKPDLSTSARAIAFYNYGLALLYSGNFTDAINQFNTASRLEPSNSDYRNAIDDAVNEMKSAQTLDEQVK
jgi:hypothetical protein